MKTIFAVAAMLLVSAALPAQSLEQMERELKHKCDIYKCPPNSFVKPWTKCLDSFGDCLCHDGYKPFNRTCIPCPFKVICKDVCKKIKTMKCKDECRIDCSKGKCKKVCRKVCTPIYTEVCKKVCRRERVCECNFECPPYSKPRPGTQCLDTIGDCRCKHGYRMVDGKCVPKCDYKCPWKSDFIGDKDDCPDNFDHCRCREGYEKKNGKCVRCKKHCVEKCVAMKGKKQCRDICEVKCEEQFVCPFKCPANSFQITKARCARDMGDCRCKSGYVPKDDKCVLER